MQAYESPTDRWAFLAPWTTRLLEYEPHIKVQYANDHTYRSTFHALELTVYDGLENDDIQAVAEAVELVAMALARCPKAWTTILRDQCECTDAFDLEDPLLMLRLEFDCSTYLRSVYEVDCATKFFSTLIDNRAHRSRAFGATQRQIEVLGENADVAPIGITVHLAPVSIRNGSMMTMSLQQFARTNRPWCVLEAIDIDWSEPYTYNNKVEDALQLVVDVPLVKVSRVTLHPQELQWSAPELHQFLTTIASTSPDLEVEMGDVRRFSLYLDDQVSNLDDKIVLVMQTIANAGVAIKSLHLGQLSTNVHQNATSRYRVWNQLFGTLLNPQAVTHIDTLDLSSHRILDDVMDADLIQTVVARYPDYRTPPSVILGVTNANQVSLRAIISAFAAKLRHLCIIDYHLPIASDTVTFILQMCPHLESLDLNNVVIPSMEIFYDQTLAPCSLSTLALTDVTLSDPSSILPFFTQLADPSSCLGRSLGEFRLARAGDPAIMWNKFVLNRTHMSRLCGALHTNGRLHTLQVEVEDETAPSIMTELMQEHRKPAAVRKGPLAHECKLAWLSATTHSNLAPTSARHALSHDVIQLVFEYAAECLPRWIHVGKSFGSS